MSDKKNNPIDKHVGARLRYRRNFLNYSQEKLGEKIGVTFQQIQKYEKGLNRISASRLKLIADVLKTNVAYFFADLPSDNKLSVNESEPPKHHFIPSKDLLKLNHAFQKIPDPSMRNKIIELVCHISDSSELLDDESINKLHKISHNKQ